MAQRRAVAEPAAPVNKRVMQPSEVRERDSHAGADVNLAGVQRHRAVRMNGQKAVDLVRVERASGRVERLPRLRRRAPRRDRKRKADDDGASGLEEIAPRDEIRCLHGYTCAARWTARMMRVCVPHRQRLPSSARVI